MFHLRDCLEGMKELDDRSVDAVVTSPPYNLDIKYSKYKDKKPREQYLKWIEDIFGECKRVLKDDGHLFVNMGYSNVDPWIGMEVGLAIRNNWELQNHINWVKSIHVNDKTSGHFKPINSKRYLCPTWEHLFHFTKDGNTEIDLEASGVPYNTDYNNAARNEKRSGKNWRPTTTCWHITYKSKATKQITRQITGDKLHKAIFPKALVKKCIQISGLKKGIIFDPFSGTGTALVVAKEMGLDFVGCEIDPDYADFINKNINENYNTLYSKEATSLYP